MSKAKELAEKLAKLNIADMYENDFFLTWEKTDDEIEAVFAVADALRDLRERNKSTKIFDSGLGISIFRDNSTRTRFSFASACNLLGLEVADLDEKKSQIAQWADIPSRYVSHQTVYSRFCKWRDDGTLLRIFQELNADADYENLCIDSTSIKAHPQSAGAKRGV